MSFQDLTLVNLLLYLLILWLLWRAIAGRFAARDLARRLDDAESSLDGDLHLHLVPHRRSDAKRADDEADTSPRGSDQPPERQKQLSRVLGRWSELHPTAQVLARVIRDRQVAADDAAVSGWIASALSSHFDDVRRRLELLLVTAPMVGLFGTISGFLAATYNFARDGDQSRMMAGVALALITTLGAVVVALLVRRALIGMLDPLQQRTRLHAWDRAVALRRRLADTRTTGRPGSSDGPEQPRLVGIEFLHRDGSLAFRTGDNGGPRRADEEED